MSSQRCSESAMEPTYAVPGSPKQYLLMFKVHVMDFKLRISFENLIVGTREMDQLCGLGT